MRALLTNFEPSRGMATPAEAGQCGAKARQPEHVGKLLTYFHGEAGHGEPRRGVAGHGNNCQRTQVTVLTYFRGLARRGGARHGRAKATTRDGRGKSRHTFSTIKQAIT